MNMQARKQAPADERDKIHEAENFYVSFLEFVESLFVYLPVKDTLDINTIVDRVKKVWKATLEDRNFLIRVLHDSGLGAAHDMNYLVSHSVRSAVIAILIGSQLRLPHHKLNELGVATLLHDAGMLDMPRGFHLNSGVLTAEEKSLLYVHPIHGCKLLQKFNFPPDVCSAVLEHHEREDGSGYPQNLPGGRISLYAKIIAVACSYEALSSKRPHKKAKGHHNGMVELLKNEGKRYDDAVVRALVYSLSIYPIGTFVLLSDGKKGLVVEANPDNPRCPFVQLLEQTQGERQRTVNTSYGVSIVRPLSREELMENEAC